MDRQKTVQIQDGFAVTCSNIISGVITFFIFLIVTVFPLIYDNSYFNILETKYKCYYLCILGMLGVSLVLALVMLVVDVKEFQGEHTKELFAGLLPKNWKKTFTVPDAALAVFWIICLISTFQSDYFYESFWGNEGRYTGLFLLTLYTVSYFLISRCWKVNGWMLELFLVSGMVMCVIGITDYFQLDILDFRGNIKPEQSTTFTSTVGNINTYTAYVAMIMGYASTMFATTGKLWKMVWYYLCMAVSFMAIIMGCSDNAYLALGILFAFLPFILFWSRRGIVRYLVILATFFTVIQAVDWINQTYADMVIGLDSLFRILAGFGSLPKVVAVLWLAALAAWLALERKKAPVGRSLGTDSHGSLSGGNAVSGSDQSDPDSPVYSRTQADMIWSSSMDPGERRMGKCLVTAWSVLIAAGVALVCFMLFDANAAGNGSRYGSLGSYLVFNDTWGTFRGYIWKKSIELYQEFPMIHKIFGYGPDTFGILTTDAIRRDMVNATGQIFDNAHNEYLNLLLTIGPVGTLAYMIFVFGCVLGMVRRKNLMKHPCVAGCCLAAVCYSAQALVNLNIPIAAPILWLMLSTGAAVCRPRQGEN